MQALFERYPFLKTYLVPIILGISGIGLIIIGIISSIVFSSGFLSPVKSENITFHNITNDINLSADRQVSSPNDTKKISKQIVVDIEGAVLKPGVYHLAVDARVQQTIEAAGGLSEDADKEYISKHINLAAKLSDGAKIYVPKIGEYPLSNGQYQMSNDNSTAILGTNDSPLNINDASADALDALPGIGKTTAQKIINSRPYTDVQDLLTKKIVSTKVFAEIKDKISVN